MNRDWIPGDARNSEAQDSLVRLLDSRSPFPLFWIDEHGRLAWCNQAAAPVFQSYDSLEDSLREIRDPEGSSLLPDPSLVEERLNRTATWGPAPAPQSWRGKLVITPLAERGALVTFQHRNTPNERFSAFEEEIEEQARNFFLTLLSHEAQSPLNVILGFGQLLSERLQDAECREIAESITQSGESLLELLSDFITAANVDSGLNRVHPISFNLRKLLDEEIVPYFRARIAEKKLTFATLENPEVPDFITSDPRHIRQILFNLLSNAVRFTETGGVSLSVNIVARKPHNKRLLSIAIMDTGPGIPESLHSRVFRPFLRYSQDNALHEDSGGIGLAIAQRLARLLGGYIRLESREGAGSTFSLEIPFEVGTHQSGQTPGAIPDFRAPPRQSKPGHFPELKVLLIMEDGANRDRFAKCMREIGINPKLLQPGDLTVSFLRNHTVDGILLDVDLPDEDPLKLAEMIRGALDPSNRPHLVAVSGSDSPDDRRNVLAAGFDAFLPRSFRGNDLKKALKQALAYPI